MKAKRVTSSSRRLRHLLLISAVVIGFTIVQFPLWSWVESRADVLQVLRTREQQQAELIRRSDDIEQLFVDQADLLEEIETVASLQDKALFAIERTETLANSYQLDIEVTSVSELEVPVDERGRRQKGTEEKRNLHPSIEELTVSTLVKGKAGPILQFIEALEHIPELAQLRNIGIEPNTFDGGTEVDPTLFQATVDITYFTQK